jgi:hypothetical protein
MNRMVMRRSIAAILLGSVIAFGIASPLAAAELVGHSAGYSMALKSAASGSGVAAVKGAMAYNFADSCDGWTVENRTSFTIYYEEGAEVETQWSFLTWEAKDGLSYRFRVNTVRDGQVIEDLQGIAKLEGKGKKGQVTLTRPKQMTIDLPPGTLFPSEHTLRLIEYAQNKGKVFSRVVFDGMSLDSPFELNAIIGLAQLPGKNPPSALLARPGWQVRMAAFPYYSQETTPDYEVSLRYRDNGVAEDIIQDYGNFAIRATLDKIEAAKKPDC